MGLVWYVAYGSNLERDRFGCYLEGGVPEGGAREYAGCTDPTPPQGDVPVQLPGRLLFGGVSTVWGGGMAFLDPGGSRDVAARGYLVTRGQLADVVAQEMRREPAGPFADRVVSALDEVDRVLTLGSGRYETVVRLGDLHGYPAYTATCEGVESLAPRPPSPPYLRTIAAGLRSAHRWDAQQVADYLVEAPGVAGSYDREDLQALA